MFNELNPTQTSTHKLPVAMQKILFRGPNSVISLHSVLEMYAKIWKQIKNLDKNTYEKLMWNEIEVNQITKSILKANQVIGITPEKQLNIWEYEARKIAECLYMFELFSSVKPTIEYFASGEYIEYLKSYHWLLGSFLSKEIAAYIMAKSLNNNEDLNDTFALQKWISGRLMAFALQEGFTVRFDFSAGCAVYSGDPIYFAYLELSNLFSNPKIKTCKAPDCQKTFYSNKKSYCSKTCQNRYQRQKDRHRKIASKQNA